MGVAKIDQSIILRIKEEEEDKLNLNVEISQMKKRKERGHGPKRDPARRKDDPERGAKILLHQLKSKVKARFAQDQNQGQGTQVIRRKIKLGFQTKVL